MSFLELSPTLEDVLAFLDDVTGDVEAPKAEAEARRKQSRAAASRRFQRKKKAELLALREQAATLQRRVRELQKANAQTESRAESERERRLRQAAELQNRQLRALLHKQKQAALVVTHLLCNVTAAVHYEEGLRTPRRMGATALSRFVPNLEDAIYGELAARMGDMYAQAGEVFAFSSLLETRFTTGKVEVCWDPTGVPYVELRAMLPIHRSVQETTDIARQKTPYDIRRYRKHYNTKLGLKEESRVELQAPYGTLPINMLTLARMYDEKDRVLSTWTSIACDNPSNASVRFCDRGWLMISAAPSNPQQKSIVQVCYRLSPDVEPGSFYVNCDSYAMTMLVLQKLGTVMRESFLEMGAMYTKECPDRDGYSMF